MDRRSAYSLYSTITLGVPGTPMAAFADLSDDQRWGLAFHVASLGDERGCAPAGRRGVGAAAATAVDSPTSRAWRWPPPPRSGRATARTARRCSRTCAPARTLAATPGASALVRSTTAAGREPAGVSRGASARGAGPRGHVATSTGFELVEPSLDAVDRSLRVTIESEMIRYRTHAARRRADLPPSRRRRIVCRRCWPTPSGARRAAGLAAGPAFVSAFVILLREGLEAVLVVAAILALLVRAGRRDAVPAVHARLARRAAARRAHVGAGLLRRDDQRRDPRGHRGRDRAGGDRWCCIWVGFWMHDKSHAARWQAYLQSRLQGALGRRATWGLAAVSFLAVYREVFETVLFYQALWLQTAPAGRHALWAGIARAAVVLALLSWLIVRGSLRLPLGVFFGATSIVLAALADRAGRQGDQGAAGGGGASRRIRSRRPACRCSASTRTWPRADAAAGAGAARGRGLHLAHARDAPRRLSGRPTSSRACIASRSLSSSRLACSRTSGCSAARLNAACAPRKSLSRSAHDARG